ncbi:hypothetical protein FQZ97_928010 [compost metagenome]
MPIGNAQETLEIARWIRTLADRQEINDLNIELGLPFARFTNRLNDLAQARNEAIMADAQEGTAWYVSDAGSFNDDSAWATTREALVPCDIVFSNEATFGGSPRDHCWYPCSGGQMEGPLCNRTKQARLLRLFFRWPTVGLNLPSDLLGRTPHLQVPLISVIRVIQT